MKREFTIRGITVYAENLIEAEDLAYLIEEELRYEAELSKIDGNFWDEDYRGE